MPNKNKYLWDFLIHPDLRSGDPLVLERSRQTVSGIMGVMPLMVFSAGLYTWQGLEPLVLPVAVSGLLLSLALILARTVASHHVSANCAVASLTLGCFNYPEIRYMPRYASVC